MFDNKFVQTDEQDAEYLDDLFESSTMPPDLWYGEERLDGKRFIWPEGRSLSFRQVVEAMISHIRKGMVYEATVEVEYDRVMTLKLQVLDPEDSKVKVIYIAQTNAPEGETFGFCNKKHWRHVLASGP